MEWLCKATMLGEASTTEFARNKDAQGYVENRDAAVAGGSVAGRARRGLEKKSGKRIAAFRLGITSPITL